MSGRLKKIEQRYETLKAHIETLPEANVKAFATEARQNPQALMQWVEQGHAVAVEIGSKANPSAVAYGDAIGHTALHYATRDHSGLMARILTDQITAAPVTKDVFGERPLDLAGSERNQNAQAVLFPITYPDLFREPELKAELAAGHERVDAFAESLSQSHEQRVTRDRSR